MLLLLIILIFSLCSKFFYVCAHDNVRLDETMHISKRLEANFPVFGDFRSIILSDHKNLGLKVKKNFSETTFLLVKKSYWMK